VPRFFSQTKTSNFLRANTSFQSAVAPPNERLATDHKFSKLVTAKPELDPRLTAFTPIKTPVASNNFDELIANEGTRLPFTFDGKDSDYSFY
jgi:hypothetical protein